MKKVIIIQARAGSSRLPEKVLAEIEGRAMLLHVTDRLSSCKNADEVIVATTEKQQDDAVAKLCADNGVKCFRGSENDVLERYYKAASNAHADVITRITADCPLICPKMVDKHIELFVSNHYDCVSPRSKDGLIRGLDNETFSFTVLENAYKNATDKDEREHVTLHIYNNPSKFRIFSPPVDDIYKSDIRFCVDEKNDMELIKKIYAKLYKKGSIIDVLDAIILVNNSPELRSINLDVHQISFDEKTQG